MPSQKLTRDEMSSKFVVQASLPIRFYELSIRVCVYICASFCLSNAIFCVYLTQYEINYWHRLNSISAPLAATNYEQEYYDRTATDS